MESQKNKTVEASFQSKEEGAKRYELLWGGGAPDAFSLLARSVRRVGTVGREKTGSYTPEDGDLMHNNIGGSHPGMVVIRRLKKEYFPHAVVVTNSFVPGKDERPDAHHAQVAARELETAGVSAEHIILQEESFSTVTEVLATIRLLEEHKWKHLVIFVNGTQINRVQAILEHIDTVYDPLTFRERPGMQEALRSFRERRERGEVRISIVSSEDALQLMSERHAKLVQAAKETPLWKATEERDNKAAEQIRAGTYGHAQNRPSTTIIEKKEEK